MYTEYKLCAFCLSFVFTYAGDALARKASPAPIIREIKGQKMIKKKNETIEPKPLTNLYLIKEFMKKQHIKEISFEKNWFGNQRLSLIIVEEEEKD